MVANGPESYRSMVTLLCNTEKPRDNCISSPLTFASPFAAMTTPWTMPCRPSPLVGRFYGDTEEDNGERVLGEGVALLRLGGGGHAT